MSDQEMTMIVLNALPEEWGNFTASIWAKKEASSLNDLWAICKVEEARLKAKEDIAVSPKSKHSLPGLKEKGSSESLKDLASSNIPRKTCQRSNALNVKDMDTTEEIVQSERRMTRGGNKRQ